MILIRKYTSWGKYDGLRMLFILQNVIKSNVNAYFLNLQLDTACSIITNLIVTELLYSYYSYLFYNNFMANFIDNSYMCIVKVLWWLPTTRLKIQIQGHMCLSSKIFHKIQFSLCKNNISFTYQYFYWHRAMKNTSICI